MPPFPPPTPHPAPPTTTTTTKHESIHTHTHTEKEIMCKIMNATVQMIHPSRTMGARYNLQSTSQNTASQGELYWGRGGNRRLSYVLDFSDLSRRSSTSYEGKVKVGLMSRAMQLSGAVSRSPVSRQMDATFHWDADRDENKNVAIKTRWTSGDMNKADVTLSLPAINQVTLESEALPSLLKR